ncbi:hypothetical protein CRENBAI_006800 [Crenichthys baileyi]|uniref:Uncharacterized protein n=1 Tax=Crenichthys baileyi TaxID=28760 RepID=A0AAV9RMQ4_9TELE
MAFAQLSACPPSNTAYHLDGTPRRSHQPAKLNGLLTFHGSSPFTCNCATRCGPTPADPETVASWKKNLFELSVCLCGGCLD